MIQVGAYPTRSDAELAQTALTAAGIPSLVAADDAGGAYPFDLTGAVRLLVDEATPKTPRRSCPSVPKQNGRSNNDDEVDPPGHRPRVPSLEVRALTGDHRRPRQCPPPLP